MNPQFVFFDLDNTLLNHSSAEASAQKDIYSSYPELQKVSQEEWVNTYQQINHNLWDRYQKDEIDRHELHHLRFHGTMTTLGIEPGRSDDIGKDYMRRYSTHWHWVDGAKEALEAISDTYPVGIVTNGFLEIQQKKIEKMGLDRFTRTFVITEEIGVMKPHQKVFDHATEKAGVNRSDILYVGDSYSSDIVGGKNAGWKTAWFTAFVSEIEDGQSADFLFDQFPMLTRYLK